MHRVGLAPGLMKVGPILPGSWANQWKGFTDSTTTYHWGRGLPALLTTLQMT